MQLSEGFEERFTPSRRSAHGDKSKTPMSLTEFGRGTSPYSPYAYIACTACYSNGLSNPQWMWMSTLWRYAEEGCLDDFDVLRTMRLSLDQELRRARL